MNILLIQLKRIGDLILTTPAIAAIRQQIPAANITLVVSRSCASILPAIPHIDRAHIIERNPADLGTYLQIARTKFDACVDFTRNNRSAVLTWLSRADKRIGSHRIKRRTRLRQKAYNEFVPGRMRDAHMVDYNLSLLGPLGIHGASPPVQLVIPAESCQAAVELQQHANIHQPFVVFHAGSARAEKFWEPDRWAEVIISAMDRWHVTPVLTGSSSPHERAHIGEIEARLPRPFARAGPNVVDLTGKIDLLTLAALIAQARLLVTVDSAPMHLAAATGTPQIVLFGPTNPYHWRPRHGSAVILRGESPVPVRDFVPRQMPMAMKLISTQTVIDAMDLLLSMPVRAGLASPDKGL